MKNFLNKFKWAILGALVVLSGTVYAVQVSVPSAINAGKLLQSLSTGNYAAVSLIAGTNVTISTTTTSITINSSGSGGGSDPFTHTSVWGQTTSATSTLLALTGSPYSLVASSTAVFTNASSTMHTNTGAFWLPSITTKTLNVDASGLVYGTATSTPTVTAPITYSGTLGQFIGGVSGTFGCTNASSGVTGCLTGTDWNTFNNKGSGTVTNVATGYGAHGGPITTTGTISPSVYATFVVSTTSTAGDFTDIQTAINALPSGGGKIHVTCGTYTLSATTTIKVANTIIEGEGDCTQFNFNKATIFTGITFNTAGLSRVKLTDFYLHQTNGTQGGIGINASNTPLLTVQRVKIDGTSTSTSVIDSQNLSFYQRWEDMDLRDNVTCIDYGGNPVNDNTNINTRCAPHSGSGGFGLYLSATTTSPSQGPQNNTFINLDVEPTGAATGLTGIFMKNAQANTFVAPYIEGLATAYNIDNTSARTVFTGGRFASNTTYTDSSISSSFIGTDQESVLKSKLPATTNINDLSTQDANLPDLQVYNNTSFAHASLDFVKFILYNGSDSSNMLNLSNAGTGALIIATSTQHNGFVLDRYARMGIGTTTPQLAGLTIASTTNPQLSLSAGGNVNQWFMRNAGGNLYIGTTTVAGTATTSTSALTLFTSGVPSMTIGTSTCMTTLKNGSLCLGGGGDTLGNSGTTTISAGKFQIDAMSTNGTRVCIMVNNSSALVVSANACTP